MKISVSPPGDLLALKQARMAPSRRSVVDLRQALLELGMMKESTLCALEREDPQLLQSRSRELVERVMVSEMDWHRAMACVAGLIEIDADTFEIDRRAFDTMPLAVAQRYGVLPLGMVDGLFFVASDKPTSEALQRQLQTACDGRAMPMVWASDDAIARRLSQLWQGTVR